MAQLLFKAFHNLLPANIQKLFTQSEQLYSLRNYGNFSVWLKPPGGVSVSVCLGLELKQCQCIHQFKELYKQMVLSQYKEGGV